MKANGNDPRRLPALSFRLKLLLAMMVVVAGVTGATLFVTQQRVQSTYQRLSEEQFRREIQFFTALRQARLLTVERRCRNFTHDVRVRQLMRRLNADADTHDETDIRLASEKVYQTAEDDLQLRETGAAAVSSPTMRRATFLRLLDARNRVLEPPASVEAGLGRPWLRQRFQQQLSLIASALSGQSGQQVGYLAPRNADGHARLLEVIVTKIIDVRNGEQVGTLVLGFPVPDLMPNPRAAKQLNPEASPLQSGLWLEDRLYSSELPEDLRSKLEADLGRRARLLQRPTGNFLTRLDGIPYRVFYRALNEGANFPPACQVCLYSLADALEEQRSLRGRILAFGGLALLGALAVSLLMSHGLAIPIRELVKGTGEIQRGNLAVKVPVRGRDEIGQLAASFNEMAAGLALKEKYRSVLDLVADKEVAQQLMGGSVALGGETREISVLFCDIRGFTALTQDMDPAEVIQLLNEHMTALTRVVYEHDGVVDKFVGDLIMAVFGAPRNYENDAHNAARCAVRMINERQQLNQTSRYRIRIGIGIASGTAVAGCMGSTDRLNYTVLGPRVNLAARLCSQAGPMEVVIDQTTRERLGALLRVEPLPELRLKGFSAPVQAFKLLEVRSLPDRHASTV
ncbi:MAG: adenylate/guanylate cyclase domain-containing protein [Verrucomicrobia bacterium]|nr:adenylate/guanylate cyclase domain-containing protein [Verrucomicrobiota bacterium]